MATLIAVAFVEATESPFVWKCSECNAAFSLDRITATPSVTQLEIVNGQFSVHCRHEHPDSPAFGLKVPAMNEDSAQAACRIVREATENK
jgi:hypothetical protein